MMKKDMLRKLRRLYATDVMMKKAGMDVPKKKRYGSFNSYSVDQYKYGIYMRCQILSGILKVAFFLADHMRTGSNKPVYELFINKETGEFITYDVIYDKWSNAKVDMLTWPGYFYESGKYINREGNRSIKRYLGVNNGGFRGILDYQLNIRKEELKQRHRRETDPWDLIMEQVPELPKDWNRWVDKVGMSQNYIFYQYDRKGVKEGYCTWCEKTVKVKKPKHNTDGKCSCCGHDITYKAIVKTGNGFYTDRETVYLIQRCEDGFVLREFSAWRQYRKGQFANPDRACFESRRTIYDKDLQSQDFYYGEYKQSETRWIKTYSSSGWHYGGKVYKKTIPALAKNELKRTGLPEMIRDIELMDPLAYLMSLSGKPYLEQLAKAGFTKLVVDVIKGYKHLGIREIRDLGKALGIDKYRMMRMRKNNGGLLYLEWLKFEKENEKNIPDEVISWYEQEDINPEKIEFIMDRMSEIQVCNYLKRQMKESGEKSKYLLSIWKDYLAMAKRMKMNTKDEIVFRTNKLVQRHQEMVSMIEDKEAAIRAGEIAEKFQMVDDICMDIKTKYEYENDIYAVIAPRGIEDILLEGRALHHCIDKSDRYFERINNRETYILFLRKKEAIDQPYYTLEVEPNGTIRQKRTEYDRQKPDIKDAEKFLGKWQQVVQKRITEEDKKLAEESKKLRNLEFEEMRQNNVLIRGGDLAGMPLADVLEKDLMEVSTEEERRVS